MVLSFCQAPEVGETGCGIICPNRTESVCAPPVRVGRGVLPRVLHVHVIPQTALVRARACPPVRPGTEAREPARSPGWPPTWSWVWGLPGFLSHWDPGALKSPSQGPRDPSLNEIKKMFLSEMVSGLPEGLRGRDKAQRGCAQRTTLPTVVHPTEAEISGDFAESCLRLARGARGFPRPLAGRTQVTALTLVCTWQLLKNQTALYFDSFSSRTKAHKYAGAHGQKSIPSP